MTSQSPPGHTTIKRPIFTGLYEKEVKKAVKMDYTLAKLYIPKSAVNGSLGKWYVYYTYRDPNTGDMEPFKERKGINRFKTFQERKKQGLILAEEINKLLKAGWGPFQEASEPEQEAMKPLPELLDDLYAIKESNVRPRSRQHYKHAKDILNQFLQDYKLAYKGAADFTVNHAQKFADFLVLDKKYSGKSFNNQIQNVRMYFNMMIDRDIIDKNPFRRIKKLTETEGLNLAYSDDQRKLLTEYMAEHNPRLLMVCKMLYYCYIRPNEQVQLLVSNIDWNNRRINIPGKVSKNRKQSSVEIPNEFFEDVKAAFFGKDPNFNLFGFKLECCGRPVHRNRISAAYKEVLGALNLPPGYTLYGWKHTGVVAAIESGVNPYNIMRQLRHSSLEQTMKYLRSMGLTANEEFSKNQPAFSQKKHSMKYLFRAECIDDVQAFFDAIPKNEIIATNIFTMKGIPDIQASVEVKSLSKEGLQLILSSLEDCHVILQTIAEEDAYTGERDYDIT